MTDEIGRLFLEIQDMRKESNASLKELRDENNQSHSAILEQQKITNGTVKKHNEVLFSPDHKEDGLVFKVNDDGKLLRKLDRKVFRFMLFGSAVIFFIGLLSGVFGSQWAEELLRDTPWNVNGLLRVLSHILGG